LVDQVKEGKMNLAKEECRADVVSLLDVEAEKLAQEVPEWSLGDNAIERGFKFKDFRQAMDFVGKVTEVAKGQDHHPDILISYNRVQLTLSTHKVGGLSRNDFILAAKIDQLVDKRAREIASLRSQ
jgi:4a-hydroxytetrahydrobiopterin dehydratase